MGNRVVVIGASLSGIQALSQLVSDLPRTFPAPVLIVQHVPAHSPGLLPRILTQAGPLPAIHPEDNEELKAGVIYVAPPDRHMLVQADHIRLSHGPKENLARPAIDPLFRSAALAFGPRVIGVVLTGQLDDGTAGLLAIKDCGGTTIVQEPSEATAPSMPRSALRHVAVDHCCTLAAISQLLEELARDPQPSTPASISQLLDIESRIAAGLFRVVDWRQLEQLGTPSGMNCPDCMAALYELSDHRFLRFRCRGGHAFSPESLLSGQAEAREKLLSAIFSTLLEEATLARRLSEDLDYAADADEVARLKAQVARLELQAEQIGASLRATVGLVTPNPTGTP